MEIKLLEEADEDLLFWIKTGNKSIQKKINQLLTSIQATPYSGIGKPEALKHHLSGLWSRRINSEHRLVYEIDENQNLIIVHSLKGHY
ncbi:Txe/YoeB family addiction module toxin [Flavobacterium sp.]|jgi:toxin YoeB|uniref:Txe/YoeB family addiction module toxin n=1 Tax=Flavobacterium sp. TaxID=239 RepID=UPI0037BE4407